MRENVKVWGTASVLNVHKSQYSLKMVLHTCGTYTVKYRWDKNKERLNRLSVTGYKEEQLGYKCENEITPDCVILCIRYVKWDDYEITMKIYKDNIVSVNVWYIVM